MTPKEAIEILMSDEKLAEIEYYCGFEGQKKVAKLYSEALDMAIEAIEKQIPKKPIIYTDTRNLLDYNGNDYGVREVDVYDCPNCGFDISDKSVCEEYEYKPSCCPECGQKLNWEDWSEEE